MKLNDLTKYEHKNKIGVAIIIVAILGAIYFGGFGPQSAFDGTTDIYIKTSQGTDVLSGDTIYESSGLCLEVRDVDPAGLRCNLYISMDDTFVSEGAHFQDGYDSTWTFDLSNVYKGKHMYYLATTEDAPWISHTFYIIGDDDSPDFTTTLPPELTFYPQDESVLVGDTSTVRWKVIYEKSAVVKIYLDEILVETMSHVGSVDEVTYEYMFSSDMDGIFTVKFKFIPDIIATIITDSVVLTAYTSSETYSNAEIVDIPVDVSFNVSESPAYLIWTFSYDGPCIVDIALDGVWDDGQSYGASVADKMFTYVVDTSVAGTYELVFTVDPDGTDNPTVSDTVMVTIVEVTTTTGSTTAPEPEPDDFNYVLIGGVAAVVIVGFVILKRRNEY
jgi:hypothetical protein